MPDLPDLSKVPVLAGLTRAELDAIPKDEGWLLTMQTLVAMDFVQRIKEVVDDLV